jgi:hypothetical protein
MAGNALTITASLQCPHGGTVQITPSNLRATAGGAALATANDVFTVVGCPFQLPTVPPIPSPCVTVQWLVTDLRVKAGSAPTLSLSSQGLCYSALQVPQGPVVIESAQPKVSST